MSHSDTPVADGEQSDLAVDAVSGELHDQEPAVETADPLERAEAAEAMVARLEREALQRRAADTAGLPQKYANRLRGETEDELLADARELAADLGEAKNPPPPIRRGPQGQREKAPALGMNTLIRRALGRD